MVADKLQIELDGIYESAEDKMIASVEVKNQEHKDFEIRQLFSAMKYFEANVPSNYKIKLLFMVRLRDKNNDTFKLYEYKFEDKTNPNSIKFVKAIEYDIMSKQTHLK